MTWRVAFSLDRLLEEIDTYAPHRRKDSDGGIGDAAHASRGSDHNPYIKLGGVGIVRARDYTHAPETGFDAYAFAEALRVGRDPRIRYVISNRRIFSGKGGPSPWAWRKYTGANPHDHHTHVSATESPSEFDDRSDWKWENMGEQVIAHAPAANVFVPPPATLRVGSRGALVSRMQAGIGMPKAKIDGWFGESETLPALKSFQKKNGIGADGVCGPQTWKLIP